MKKIILIISTIVFVSCNKTSSTQKNIKAQKVNTSTKLYCGKIQYGCEDVNTDTLEIDLSNLEQIKIVRQFHGSDLPITSSFIGKFKSKNEITATYSKELTTKTWRQVQEQFPQGEISLHLTCDNLKTFINCKVTGESVGKDESLKKFPGWEKEYSDVKNLVCNTKQFTTTQASEKECESSEND